MATEYERKRLENIRRNDEMMAALNIRSKASSLLPAATAAKRLRDDIKSFRKKKPKPETPVVIRQSRRTRGLDPDFGGLPDVFSDYPKRTRNTPSPKKQSPCLLAPLPFDSTCEGKGSHTQLVDTLLGVASNKSCRGKLVKGEIGSVKDENESPMVITRSTSRASKVFVKKEEPDDSFSDCVKKEFDFTLKPEKIEFKDGFDTDLLSLEPNH